MGRKRKKEPLYRQAWFLAILGLVVATLTLCVLAYQSGFFADVWKRSLGPPPDQEAQKRALYDEAMRDFQEALRRGDPSILEERWCGEARETAKQMVLEGGMRRVRVTRVKYGLRFLEPDMTVDEVWIKGTEAMSYTNKVRLDMGRGCIIVFDPTMLIPY